MFKAKNLIEIAKKVLKEKEHITEKLTPAFEKAQEIYKDVAIDVVKGKIESKKEAKEREKEDIQKKLKKRQEEKPEPEPEISQTQIEASEKKAKEVQTEEEIAEQKRLKREAKRAMIEANIAKSKLVEKPETVSLPEPDIEKALVKVENPKIVKMIDDALDQLIEGLITKSARDVIDKMDKLFTDISVVKGHGKSFENILCNTDFKYVLQSISGSTSPILNNDDNRKLKGHLAKYKRDGKDVPLSEVCVYDLHDGISSYECKNYFGTKTWIGEYYYGNTTGITMQIDKFEGNINFTPYFNKVNGQWKLYNILVEYSHEVGGPKHKWLYKNYNTDVIFVVLCKDALVYYNLTDDFEQYAYEPNKEGLENKNKELLTKINMTRTLKLKVVNPKSNNEIYIPTNKFKPIIPI